MVQSLRDLGYEFPSAVADLIDNSLTARATRVTVEMAFAGAKSWVRIADNGSGMTPQRLTEALRYGSDASYGERDLGKFGLGLKTASLSQCRRLTVSTRDAAGRTAARRLDLDRVVRRDRWEITDVDPDRDRRLTLRAGSGTVALWEGLDRVLQYSDPESEWARSGLRALAERTDQHLAMVLHRFLDGSAEGAKKVHLSINGTPVEPWDPFARSEPHTLALDPEELMLETPNGSGTVGYAGYVLPPREQFSSELAFRRAAGPKKWNRQQGFYVYRADRMIQSGGWSWMRTADEHTKLARAALDFLPELDAAFGLNVAKVHILLPPELKAQLDGRVATLVKAAQVSYRAKAEPGAEPPTQTHTGMTGRSTREARAQYSAVGRVLTQAAKKVEESEALARIVEQVREDAPEVARDIGW